MTVARLCDPAKIYLILSLVFLVFGIFTRMTVMALMIKAFFIFFWTIVLNWMCSAGLKFFAWFLVLLPFLAIFLSVGMSMDLMALGKGPEGFVRT